MWYQVSSDMIVRYSHDNERGLETAAIYISAGYVVVTQTGITVVQRSDRFTLMQGMTSHNAPYSI